MTDNTTAELRGHPVPGSAQCKYIERQDLIMVGTIAEIMPELDDGPRPKSDADHLLRMIPGGLMTGVRREPSQANMWDPVIALGLPMRGEFVKVRSGEFREYLAALFMQETGRVLKADRREDVIVALGGLVALAFAERRAAENARWQKLRDAEAAPADDLAEDA